MATVPLEWRLQVKGGNDVKNQLNEINAAFDRNELSATEYAKRLREVSADARSLNNIQNLQKNLFLASHPGVQRLSRAMSTFASVARTAMTITNALNLATIATNGVNSELVEAEVELARAQREVNDLFRQGKEGTEEYQVALENLAIAQARVDELIERQREQDFQNFITAAATAITAVTSVFNVALQSSTIRSAAIRAGAALGGIFAGSFSFVSSALIAAGQWLKALILPQNFSKSAVAGGIHGGWFGGAFNAISSAMMRAGAWFRALISPAVVSKAAIGGTVTGGAFGSAFAAAAAIVIPAALVAVIAGAIDVISEALTGFSFVRVLTDALLGEGQGFSVRDALGIPQEGLPLFETLFGKQGLSAEDLFKQDERQERFGGKPLGIDFGSIFGGAQIEGLDFTSLDIATPKFKDMEELIGTMMPEAYAKNEDAFNQTFAQNLPNMINESTPIITGGFQQMWNTVIGATNFAGDALTGATNQIFKMLIDNMNRMITAYNVAARKMGKPPISPIKFSPGRFESVESIPAIAAAKGFNGIVDRPTLFLAGEAGSESVNITPNGTASGGGGGNTVIVNVRGSIIAERELTQMVDKNLKAKFKARGFTAI
jgi:hypothetical protein